LMSCSRLRGQAGDKLASAIERESDDNLARHHGAAPATSAARSAARGEYASQLAVLLPPARGRRRQGAQEKRSLRE
jgi:hypothetical protein